MLICYDLRFPESLRILALQGAELVVVPTAWVGGFDRADTTDGRIGQVDGVLVQANLNQVFVVRRPGRPHRAPRVPRPVRGGRSVRAGRGRSALGDRGQCGRRRHRPARRPPSTCKRGPGISPRANRRTDVYDDLLGYRSTTGGAWGGRPADESENRAVVVLANVPRRDARRRGWSSSAMAPTWRAGHWRGGGRVDLALADNLARLQLEARRVGCSIELPSAGARASLELLDLVGLTELRPA